MERVRVFMRDCGKYCARAVRAYEFARQGRGAVITFFRITRKRIPPAADVCARTFYGNRYLWMYLGVCCVRVVTNFLQACAFSPIITLRIFLNAALFSPSSNLREIRGFIF